VVEVELLVEDMPPRVEVYRHDGGNSAALLLVFL
jgi:hypothetical protein